MASQRSPMTFDFIGVDLSAPVDRLSVGKYPIATNIRSYTKGAVQPRGGLTAVNAAAFGGVLPLHTILRLNDPTPFASQAAIRALGVGTGLYTGPPNGPYTGLISALSGNPLTAFIASPVQSPQPWLYVADANAYNKFNVTPTQYPVGIAQPLTPPSVVLTQAGLNIISDFEATTNWVASGVVAGAPTLVTRVDAATVTITAILYDSGVSGSYASVAPSAMANIGLGTLLSLGAAETVLVTDVKPAVASTTIGAIIYDAGTTGLCTIQPAASLGTGGLITPSINRLAQMYGYDEPGNIPVSPSFSWPVDFPVNCVLRLNSGGGTDEYVRVISTAVGTDGVQSFRCKTVNTHAAAETIDGIASFRAFVTTARVAGNSVGTKNLKNLLTVGAASIMVGGIKNVTNTPNLALIGTRAVQPDDELHLSLNVDLLQNVTEVRLYLDVDVAGGGGGSVFLQNYYMAVWRSNDLVSAIQSVNAATVSTLQSARLVALTQDQVDQAIAQYGPAIATGLAQGTLSLVDFPLGQPLSPTGSQLAIGNNQWVELRMRVKNLARVGTDTTRTLANVGAVQILVSASNANNLNVQYDALWLQGGYGPDVTDVGQPIRWCYRYRSSITGEVSNVSPPNFGGLSPRRQRIQLTPTASASGQANLIDYFRFGGSLTKWTYIGTGPNTAVAFNDDTTDGAIDGGLSPTFQDFQPWPTLDKPRTGTCAVAGNAIAWTTGDVFNLAWAPGTPIIVNGRVCTIQQILSTTRLLLSENAGSGTGLTFSIQGAQVLGQPLPYVWGPHAHGDGAQQYFASGDPNNPGVLYWSQPNNPDLTSDTYNVVITDGTDPLQTGFVYDTENFVFSLGHLWRIAQGPNGVGHIGIKTSCGRGLRWSPWAWCLAPEGCYFLSDDGIYLTKSGSTAVSIDDDVSLLLPFDGQPGVSVNGYAPVDPTKTPRLSYADGYLYFDYTDTQNNRQTLVWNTFTKGWVVDIYVQAGIGANGSTQGTNSGAAVHAADIGSAVHTTLVGGSDGKLYKFGGTLDGATAFPCQIRTPSRNEGDSRGVKTYQDVLLAVDTAGVSVTVLAGFNLFATTLTIDAALVQSGRANVPLVFQGGTTVPALDFGLDFSWRAAGAVTLYEWQPRAIIEPGDILSAAWQTKGSALGIAGYKHLHDGYIAYASSSVVTVELFVDGVGYILATLPSTNGVYTKTYIVFPIAKGLIFTLFITSTAAFELFPRDCEFRCKGWDMAGAYTPVNPFLEQYAA